MNSLTNIPGIGDRTSRRLVEHFKSEEAVMSAFSRNDIAAIAGVPGISEKNAISLMQSFIFKDENISPGDFLKTKEGLRVYKDLLDIIRSYTSTTYAKDKLNIFFPLPSSENDRIRSVIGDVEAACSLVNTVALNEGEIEQLRKKLKHLKPIKKVTTKKIRERVIVTASQKEYQSALSEYGHAVDVLLIQSPRELIDAVASYHHVIASMDLEGVDISFDANIEYLDITRLETWYAVPEQEINFFSHNLASIISAVQVYNIIIEKNNSFFSTIDPASVNCLETTLAVINDKGNVETGSDEQIDRIQSALKRLDSCIKTVEQKANTQFKEYLESCTVTLSGKDLLSAVESGAKDLLNKEIAGRYREIIKNALSCITTTLELNSKEALLLDSLFGNDIKTMIQADTGAVEHLRQFLNIQLTGQRMKILRKSARNLLELKHITSQLVSEAMELDMWFAIGLFARDRGTVIPKLYDKAGIEIIKGKNIFIKGDIEPVDYSLGEKQIEAAIDSYSPERVAILSGVNSGGKTSMLDLIAQVLVLSHMGFPVPATRAAVGSIDKLYYFGKSRGSMDAGAFESTIMEFSVVSGTGRIMILVDELESITEPGASARIISGILEALTENPLASGVFVSHLAENIIEQTSATVRVDGIEAQGLDEDLNLIVDRNPKYNYIAKSTPELILERLTRKAKGEKKDFYNRLLEKFK
ncbi:MAG: endonuclease MutS2 [Methanosarcinales archaeon]|nr:endonuclease MutS2 [Methanosarcinales archaeon]